MFDLVKELVQVNFIPLCSLIFLYIFLKRNEAYEQDISKLFYPVLGMVLLLLTEDNIDYYLFDIGDSGMFHVIITILGYNLRVFILVALMEIAMRNRSVYRANILKDWKRIVLYGPLVLNFIITCLGFFPKLHLVFWFDESGEFLRGPLTYTPHIVSFIYSIMLIYYSIYIWRRQHRGNEALIVILTTVFAILGTVSETIFFVRGILIGFIAIAITFYYLCIHIEYFKYDILTGAFNRTSFEADIKQIHSNEGGAIFSIDLNDLKLINDREGHLAGDEALKTTARIAGSALNYKSKLYRIGGDEFAIISRNLPEDEIKKLLSYMDAEMRKTRYSFAVGYAMWKKGEKFADVFAQADKRMYENKAIIKGGEEYIRDSKPAKA